jgi:hypothetical protein
MLSLENAMLNSLKMAVRFEPKEIGLDDEGKSRGLPYIGAMD